MQINIDFMMGLKYNSIERNLILKYCPRIIFYIKKNLPERILWRIK
jgi:hypothetical protein